eukprot:gene42237-56103_t
MLLRRLTLVLLGSISAYAFAASAQAADLILDPTPIVDQGDAMLPAVSGVNGKWEFDPGVADGGGLIRGAGSLTAPLGDRFGIQGDVMASWNSATGLAYGGALHAFSRDPSSYLLGVTAGVVVVPGASIGALGVEGELYLDRISLEGWAGVAGLNYVDPGLLDKTGAFAMGDLAYYPTDDWRLTLGGSYVLGDLSVHGGSEYLFHDLPLPLSITADARLHNTGNYSFTIGLKGYFGGDESKSLINRQRQDDPRNRGLDLFTGAGNQLYATPDNVIPDNEASCVANEQSTDSWTWWPTFETCFPAGFDPRDQ